MQIVLQPITGEETPALGQEGLTPYRALVDFYRAFNRRDMRAMEANWSRTEAASMSNPLGDVRRGWNEIRSVYTRIFTGAARVQVEFYDYSLHLGSDMFCAVGRERGWVEVDNERIELAIRTSRVYCLEQNSWRQLHHHGSIDAPGLLAHYQECVRRTIMT